MEDIVLCEGVQNGLESPAYCSGRHAPAVEAAMHHFHFNPLLQDDKSFIERSLKESERVQRMALSHLHTAAAGMLLLLRQPCTISIAVNPLLQDDKSFIERSLKESERVQAVNPLLQDDKSFIERSLKESERVQMEDIVLCEGVQNGLESPAYCSGRHAPAVEAAMHHFHCLLHQNLMDQ
ncbi:choline monooxygenase, chloroplastic isoform X1 [Cinnamomum micranthum f. kanehirae]|uniref:Choline monooxygenase, chloroplastic n=1 Tax=Cinnamomum micranthum f. kanehirae TaxID=337451 RepID=A0A3S3QXZ2_9MAGN|nr:choline monooxygenase, chloroplastic isoform X1 [Cinnamomum micranthum f. kanehirae]